jgi:hypothetical protein
MKRGKATTVVGFAWYVCPEPGRRDVGPAAWPFAQSPRPAWALVGDEPGLQNCSPGPAFLVPTEAPVPPALDPGWRAEPAEIDEDTFRTSTGWLRLVRVVETRRTPQGTAQRCEFEVVGWEDEDGA